MPSLLDKAANGYSFAVRPGTKLGKLMRRNGVTKTVELGRIERLPRREPGLKDAEWAEAVSNYLRKPGGSMTLRPFQAAALRELHDFGGCFIQGRVGIGKTLISFLAPALAGARRPLLLVPAKLREKTKREFELLAKHWVGMPMRIESYARISRLNGDELLNQIAPDLIVADECHKLKSKKSAVTKRVSRWVQNHPETKFVAMSGTVASRSLMDFAHVLYWCVPRGCPLPTRWSDLQEWALCVDEKLPPGVARLTPGALEVLIGPEDKPDDNDEIGTARRAIQRRIRDTPGCIMSTDRYVGSSLSIDVARGLAVPQGAAEAMTRLRDYWETPEGMPLADAMQIHRVAMELSMGFYYRWEPEPEPEWLLARKEWCAAVRYILKVNRSGLDSELPVRNAVASGRYDGQYVMQEGMQVLDAPIPELLARWSEIKPTYDYVTVPVWLDDATVESAAAFGADVLWVKHRAVGQRLAAATGRPYFAQGGLTEDGALHIYDHHGPCVASWVACGEGLNLQRWSSQLILTPPSSGKMWEQLLGRMHRDGQTAEEVETYLTMLSEEHYGAWAQARADARFLEDTTGQEQKLLYADVLVPDYERLVGAWPFWV